MQALAKKIYMTDTKSLMFDLKECVRRVSAEDRFAFDLETTGLCPRTDRIRGIALATDSTQWYFKTLGSGSLPLATLREELRPVLIDTTKLCIGHNLKFDLQFCAANGIDVFNRIGDSMILAYALDENRSNTGRLRLKGKGGLVDELFDVELDEWQDSALAGGLFGKPEEVYAKSDVEWTLKCWVKLHRSLGRDKHTQKFFWEVAMPMVRILAEMESAGFCLDTEYLAGYARRLQRDADAIEKAAGELIGKTLNIGSSEALSRYLFDDESGPKLKPKPWMQRGKKGLYSTDESTLSRYSKDCKLCDMVLEWRGKKKLLSTYVVPFKERADKDTDKRIYCNFNQTGTVTARLCVAGNTVLRTSAGSVFIKDIDLIKHPECSIITHLGRRRRIINKFYKGEEVMYDVTTEDGNTIRCTGGHRVHTRFGWKSVRDIKVGDEVSSYRVSNSSLSFRNRKNNGNTVERLLPENNSERWVNKRSRTESRREPISVVSSKGCLRERGSRSSERESSRELLKSDERKQKRSSGEADPGYSKRKSRGTDSSRIRSVLNSKRIENYRVFGSIEPYLPWFAGDSGVSLQEIRVFSRNICEAHRDLQSWNRGEGEKICGRQGGIFRCSVRSLSKCSGSEIRDKKHGRVARPLSEDKTNTEESCLLVGQQSGGDAVCRFFENGSTSFKAGTRRKVCFGFSCRGEDCCRSRWRFSQERPGDNTEGQEKGRVFKKERVQDSSIYGEGCVDASGELCQDSSEHTEFFFSRVSSIISVGIEGVWDIEVEEDHSYLAQGFVNHNSSSDPNLQNIPRPDKKAEDNMKRAFIAPSGKSLICADYSQLELRLMAHRSQDPTMLEIYRTGGDIHDVTQKALGLEERTVAKNANFGLIYGLSAQGLKDTLWSKAKMDKSEEECQKWRYGFFNTYSAIPLYHKKVEYSLREHGYVKTIIGRKRRLKELADTDFQQALRMAINFTIQGSAADLMMIAMRNIRRQFEIKRMNDSKWNGVLLLVQVHDELVIEAPEDIVQDVVQVVKHEMENAVKLSVPLEVAPKTAKTWEAAK